MTPSYGIHEKLNYDPPVCNGQTGHDTKIHFVTMK